MVCRVGHGEHTGAWRVHGHQLHGATLHIQGEHVLQVVTGISCIAGSALLVHYRSQYTKPEHADAVIIASITTTNLETRVIAHSMA